MPRVPTRLNMRWSPTRRKPKTGSKRTHDHGIERQEDPAFCPVCLRVRRDVVDEETGTNEEDDFEQICALFQPLPSIRITR